MSIRLPQQVVFSQDLSISSGTSAQVVNLPQDTDNITVFAWCTTMGATSDDLYIQTSFDGGSTWYDMGNTQFVGTVVQSLARIMNFSGIGAKAKTGALTGSNVGNAPAASTLANNVTGVPLLGQLIRVYHAIGGSGASVINVRIVANNQSATA